MKIDEYKILIENKKFFEAHEALEEFWFPRRKQKDDLTLIVKGFINAAVAFELKKRGRDSRAIKVFNTYKKFSIKIKADSEYNFSELKKFIDEYAKKYLKEEI